MRAQSEILVFMLLFLLSMSLFTIAVFWGKDIFQKNIDMTRVSTSENFMKEMDKSIKSLIKSDGHQEIDYKVDGLLKIINNRTIETRTVITSDISLSKEWVNITSDSSCISEKLDGDVFRVQLTYAESESYRIELFTEGPTLSRPEIVRVEKNTTHYENGKLTIKIKVTFA